MSRSLRVLLISANTEKLPDPVFPIGAAYMAAVAEHHGHRVETLDLRHDRLFDLVRSHGHFDAAEIGPIGVPGVRANPHSAF